MTDTEAKEREERNARLTARQVANIPWDHPTKGTHYSPKKQHNPGPAMPLASDPGDVSRAKLDKAETQALYDELTEKPKPKTEETGPRVMLRVCFPNIIGYPLVKTNMENELVAFAGGYTSYPMRGGWRSGHGAIMHEHGIVYEVSGETLKSHIWAKDARAIFEATAHAIGEEWLHCELHHFDAMHVKTC